jgi:hypothetical protein
MNSGRPTRYDDGRIQEHSDLNNGAFHAQVEDPYQKPPAHAGVRHLFLDHACPAACADS